MGPPVTQKFQFSKTTTSRVGCLIKEMTHNRTYHSTMICCCGTLCIASIIMFLSVKIICCVFLCIAVALVILDRFLNFKSNQSGKCKGGSRREDSNTMETSLSL